ncbi:MAG: Ig-like domain-containing protein [Paludibacteraceae bacterium]|nr:Ig-like domain-containing protein [Paludibacteraceae bacterium]
MKKLLVCVAACLMALTTFAAELNIYASGLKAGGMSADKKVQVEYLLNAPATTLTIEVLNADESVALSVPVTEAAGLTKGRHTVTLDLAALAEGAYAWRVTAAAEARTEVEMVSDNSASYILYAPKGVAVNVYPDTEDFGTVYVSMPSNGADDGGSQTSKTQQMGIFVWNALLELQNAGNAGYKGGVEWAAGSPFRVQVAEDGKVFVDGYNDNLHGVWMIDGKMAGDFQKVLTNTGKCYGFDVEKSANGYSFYTMEDIVYQTTGSVKKYVDVQVPYNDEGVEIADIKNLWAQTWSNLALDGKGGMFLSQYRGADATNLPILAHLSAAGEFDWFSATANLGLATTTRGAMAINKNKTLLAAGNRANGNKVSVFNITWNEGVPVLTLAYETPAFAGGNNDGVAFDYADNLYSVNSGSELLYVWATPKAVNSAVTPAPAAQAIVVTNTVVNVTGVTLDAATADMKVGEQKTLVATVAPDNATNKSVTWSTSDETLATVTSEGQVSALKAGTVTITVTTADGAKTAECVITITNVDVESVALNRSHIYIYPGDNNQLTATVAPANATVKDVTYASSDTAVATVTAEGLITAVAVGEAVVTVTTVDGGKTAECAVTVQEPEYPNVMAYGLKLVEGEALTVGFNLNAPATEVQVIAYDTLGTEYVVATAANLAPEYQTLAINTDELPAGTYTWAVKANGVEDEEMFEPVLVHAYTTPKFVKPRGVAMDNNYNSPYFGQIYVADAGSTVENAGLYVFDPVLTGDGEIYTSGWSASPASPMRPFVGEDGLVYVTDWSDNEGNIHIFDPAMPDSNRVVFGGTFSGAGGVWNTEDGKYIHGSISSCYVTGTGADRVLYTFDEDYTPEVGHAMCMLRYNIGTLDTPWDTAPSAVAYNNADKFEQNGDSKIIPSVMGGWWISQDRAADSHEIPALIHVAADSTVNYNSGGSHGGRTRGALAFNEDQTICVTAADNAIRVWTVEWSADSVPTLTPDQGITTTFGSQNSSSCYDIAIDRALNVYATGDNKPLCIWALVKDENSCITPAADALTFTVEEKKDALDNVTAQKVLSGVYDLIGRYLGETVDNLPKGVYIVNGEKVIK